MLFISSIVPNKNAQMSERTLTLLNSDFMVEQAGIFAARLKREVSTSTRRQVDRALRLVTQRPPTSGEVARGVSLLKSLQSKDKLGADDALMAYCLLVLNLNEFVYLD